MLPDGRGEGTHFLGQLSPFLEIGCCSLCSYLPWRLAGHPLPPNSLHPEGLGKEYLSLQRWKMTSLLKCMNFYLQRTSCFPPKAVLCKGPETRLAVYEPVNCLQPDLFLLACNLMPTTSVCHVTFPRLCGKVELQLCWGTHVDGSVATTAEIPLHSWAL